MKRVGWLLFLVAAVLLAVAVVANAQQAKNLSRIGLLTGSILAPASSPGSIEQGLVKLGYVEGQNVAFERRSASGQMDHLPELAAELARLPLDVIVAVSFPAAYAAKQATSTIPIVFSGAGDPVATGLIASFSPARWEHDRSERFGNRAKW